MKRWVKPLVLLCAAVTVWSFFRPSVPVILLNAALVFFLLRKGYLESAKKEREHGEKTKIGG